MHCVTTLDEIWRHRPCTRGWHKLLNYFDKPAAGNEPLPLSTVLESNGLYDAAWCLQAVDGCEREVRLFLVWCARRAIGSGIDARLAAALDTAEKYARGESDKASLYAAAPHTPFEQVMGLDLVRCAIDDSVELYAWSHISSAVALSAARHRCTVDVEIGVFAEKFREMFCTE